MPDAVRIYSRSLQGVLRQSEILSGVVEYRLLPETVGSDAPVVDFVIHPFCVVLSQDCDLEADATRRSKDGGAAVYSILLCKASKTLDASFPDSSIMKRARANREERYHFLREVDAAFDSMGEGLPALFLDFRQWFALPPEILYAQLGRQTEGGAASVCQRAFLESPYLEHLSVRFAAFMSRVALPQQHHCQLQD